MKPILEKRFNYKGHPCVVLFMPGAHRCGYVGIPKTHKLAKYGANLDSISCHGGITYSKSKLHCCDDEDTWWIGFDCAHFNDGYDIETAKQYFGDDPDFKMSFSIMKDLWESTNEEYKFQSLKDVQNECKRIVDQLERM